MKRVITLLIIMLLAACGFSKGEDVMVLPNDSPMRSSAWHGVFEKSNGDTSVISQNGKFVTVPSNEVFSVHDEDARHIVDSRKEFYRIYSSNLNELNQESIRSLVIEKANEARLNDWVAFLELIPSIAEFNQRVASGGHSVEELSDAWDDLFDSLSDLEEEVSQLTKSAGQTGTAMGSILGLEELNQMAKSSGQMENLLGSLGLLKRMTQDASFALLVFGQVKLPVSDAISNIYKTSDASNVGEWSKLIEKSFKLLPIRMNEAKHMALLAGKTLSDADVEKVRVATTNKIIADTLPSSIALASAELKENTTSVALVNFLNDKLNYPKDALAKFHKKKSWDELLVAAQNVDKWAEILTSDHWNGDVSIKRRYYARVHDKLDLRVFFKNSLLKPIAEMTRSDGTVLKGIVRKSEGGIQIKDDLGNWNWQGHFDNEGALAVSGRYPHGSYVYTINTKFNSPIALKKLEEARLAEAKHLEEVRLAALNQQLKEKASKKTNIDKPIISNAQLPTVKPSVVNHPVAIATPPAQTHVVSKPKTVKKVPKKTVKKHSNSLSSSDSEKLNQAIHSLKALL